MSHLLTVVNGGMGHRI